MTIPSIVVPFLYCILLLLPASSPAQSEQQGVRLFDEAVQLREKSHAAEDLEAAIQKFRQALAIFRQKSSIEKQALTLYHIGRACADLRKHEEALDFYRKSLAMERGLGNQKRVATLLNSTGKVYLSISNYSKALEYLTKSRTKYRELGDEKNESSALNEIGMIHIITGNPKNALECFKKALIVHRRIKEASSEAYSLTGLGLAYVSLKDYVKAADGLKRAHTMYVKLGDVTGQANTLNAIAVMYVRRYQYAQALPYFEQALALYQKSKDLKGQGAVLNRIGIVYFTMSKYDEALRSFERASAIFRQLSDPDGQGYSDTNAGHIHAARSNFKKALQLYNQALKMYRKSGDLDRQATVLNEMGLTYWRQGGYDKALDLLEKALDIQKEIGDQLGIGRTLNNLGLIYSDRSDYGKALEYYEKSLAVDERTGNLHGLGTTLDNMGKVYWKLDDYDKALKLFHDSLEKKQKTKDIGGVGITYNNMGLIYRDSGRYKEALTAFDKALNIHKKLGDLDEEGTTLDNIAQVYRLLGRYRKAFELHENALAIEQQVGDRAGESVSTNNLALLYSECGQYKKARELFLKALAIDRELGLLKDEAVTLGNIADIHNIQGDHDKALQFYSEKLKIEKRIGVPFSSTEDSIGNIYLDKGDIRKAEPFLRAGGYWVSLGRLELMRSNFHDAVTYFSKSLKAASKSRNYKSLFTSNSGLGLSYEALEEYEKAVHHYQKAIELTEETRESLNPAQRANFYDVVTWGFRRLAPYEGLARVFLKMGKWEASLRQAEGTKARTFAENLARRSEGVSFNVPESVVTKDKEINYRLSAAIKAFHKAWEEGNAEAAKSQRIRLAALRTERNAFVEELRASYPLYAATKYPQPMKLSRTGLKDHEWTLEYEVTDQGICMYLMRGKKILKARFTPIERKDLDALARRFKDPCEVNYSQSLVTALESFSLDGGRRLADILVTDILSDLPPGAPLIIIPDDSLAVLPFEMLVLGPEGRISNDRPFPKAVEVNFFGDRNPVSYYQSITALTLVRTIRPRRRTDKRLLVMADPVYAVSDPRAGQAQQALQTPTHKKYYITLMDGISAASTDSPTFNRLNLTGKLAEKLSEIYHDGADVYVGLDASKRNLLTVIAGKLDRYEALAFASHGIFDTKNPGFSEPILVLTLVPPGTDGFVRMSEVMGLKMGAETVALIGCRTGLGGQISGEGNMSMGRAFQYAGAKCVLMSLWSVAEKSSVMLVESFFKHMKQGRSKMEALQLARKEIREAGYDHPFFWAPFILVGEVN